MLAAFPFYEEAITPGAEDFKKLSMICGTKQSFERYGGEKLCGGFHPDWCLEWNEGDAVCHMLICFGCREARLYGLKEELWTDLDKEAMKKLGVVLRAYRKNRPQAEESQ